MTPCAFCLVREYGSDQSKDALIVWQAQQLDRLLGGGYEAPDPEWLIADEDEEEDEAPSVDALFVVESLMGHEDIWRKPARVAAPRLIERLAKAGLQLVPMEEAS